MNKGTKRILAWMQILSLSAATALSGMPVSAAGEKGAQEEEAEIARESSFNKDWRFYLEDGTSIQAEGKDFDDSGWRKLDLPHDYSIEQDFDPDSPSGSNGGFLNAGVGWYRKTFVLPKEMAGKRISVSFGGVYMDSTTYVNGTMVGNYPYGYSAFSYDITDYVVADGITENVIAVKVNHQQPSSRWYSGSGIYRNVKLVVTDNVHVERYGTFVTTPDLEQHYAEGNAVVSVETKVENENQDAVNAVVKSTIYDSEGNIFKETQATGEETIGAGQVFTYEQSIDVDQPELWSVDAPNLYELVTEVVVGDDIVDTYHTTFGFKWVEMDANEGFSLNGEYMKLKGVCMHHDQGALGAVANYRAIERQMETMKSMGVNAIRVTHNPAADELLEICNKKGLLVIEEAFDCWESSKRDMDYARFFNKTATHPDAEPGTTWAEFDIKQMVNRGKNNPCIIMWSIGNEIVRATPGTAEKLVGWIKEIDTIHPTTQGYNSFINSFDNTSAKAVASVTDVVGFNYGEKKCTYDQAHEEFPDWIIVGSETSSAVRSRGFYKNDNTKKIRSSYDDSGTVSWGSSVEKSWKNNRDRKFVMGEFIWTGFDYIGEPSPYNNSFPAKSSYFGAVDTAGIPKDAYYMYQSQWTSAEENPMVHIMPHWNWENDTSIMKNGAIDVQVYSNAASVELYLNGESLGKKEFLQLETDYGMAYQEAEDGHIYLQWQVPYEPGELKAVARDGQGNVIAEDIMRTAGEPASIRLTPDRRVITADGYDLSYILVEVLDKDGNVVPTADNLVKFQIGGNGEIAGVDNGDATDVEDRYKGSERKAYSGKAMVIVQSSEEAGAVSLSATSAGLTGATVTLFTTKGEVSENTILGYEQSEDVYVKKGEELVLPDTVKAVYGDESSEEKTVTWEKVDESILEIPGVHTVEGVVDETSAAVSIRIIVVDFIGVKPVHVLTGTGNLPSLPDTVKAVFNTGEETEISVTWEEIPPSAVEQAGVFEVRGTTQEMGEVTASVRVTDQKTITEKNIAIRDASTGYPIPSASYVQDNGHDPAEAINNGTIVYSSGQTEERWIPWKHGEQNEWIQLEFEESQEISKVGLHFWSKPTDTTIATPDSVTISYSMDGEKWTDVTNQSIGVEADFDLEAENIFTFDTVTAKYIRWNFYNEAKKAPGVSEVTVYVEEEELADNGTSSKLSGIYVNGEEMKEFSADRSSYTLELPYKGQVPEITAVAEDSNASVFVIPALTKNGTTVIEVVSEDGNSSSKYQIQLQERCLHWRASSFLWKAGS